MIFLLERLESWIAIDQTRENARLILLVLLDFANPKAPRIARIFSCIWVMRARVASLIQLSRVKTRQFLSIGGARGARPSRRGEGRGARPSLTTMYGFRPGPAPRVKNQPNSRLVLDEMQMNSFKSLYKHNLVFTAAHAAITAKCNQLQYNCVPQINHDRSLKPVA